MRRLIRNIEGEQPPLIMHRRLSWLRALDTRLRYRVCRSLRLQFRGPQYMLAVGTPEQESRTLLAIEAFVGMRCPDPRVARYFNERRRWVQITDPATSDEVKRTLVAEGPRCAPEDEAYVLSTMDPARQYMAKPEGQVALARLKGAADETIRRLAPSPETALALGT